jgi:hypothetical protein
MPPVKIKFPAVHNMSAAKKELVLLPGRGPSTDHARDDMLNAYTLGDAAPATKNRPSPPAEAPQDPVCQGAHASKEGSSKVAPAACWAQYQYTKGGPRTRCAPPRKIAGHAPSPPPPPPPLHHPHPHKTSKRQIRGRASARTPAAGTTPPGVKDNQFPSDGLAPAPTDARPAHTATDSARRARCHRQPHEAHARPYLGTGKEGDTGELYHPTILHTTCITYIPTYTQGGCGVQASWGRGGGGQWGREWAAFRTIFVGIKYFRPPAHPPQPTKEASDIFREKIGEAEQRD